MNTRVVICSVVLISHPARLQKLGLVKTRIVRSEHRSHGGCGLCLLVRREVVRSQKHQSELAVVLSGHALIIPRQAPKVKRCGCGCLKVRMSQSGIGVSHFAIRWWHARALRVSQNETDKTKKEATPRPKGAAPDRPTHRPTACHSCRTGLRSL